MLSAIKQNVVASMAALTEGINKLPLFKELSNSIKAKTVLAPGAVFITFHFLCNLHMGLISKSVFP
jgi:hypothetical protein